MPLLPDGVEIISDGADQYYYDPELGMVPVPVVDNSDAILLQVNNWLAAQGDLPGVKAFKVTTGMQIYAPGGAQLYPDKVFYNFGNGIGVFLPNKVIGDPRFTPAPKHGDGFFQADAYDPRALLSEMPGLIIPLTAATAGLASGLAAGSTEVVGSEVVASDTLTFTGNVAGEGSVIAPAAETTGATSLSTNEGVSMAIDDESAFDVGAISQGGNNSLPATDYSIFTGDTTTVATPDAPGVGDGGAFDQFGSVDPGTGQVIGGSTADTYPADNSLPQGLVDQLKSLGTKAASGIVARLTNSAAASGSAANPNLRATAAKGTGQGNFLAQKAPSNAVTRFLNPSGNPANQPTQMVYLLVIGLVISVLGFVFLAAARK